MRGAFSGMGINLSSALTEGIEIILPNSLSYVGDYAFQMVQINNVKLPLNLKIIGDYAFSYNQLNYNLKIPSSVEIIRNDAFHNNRHLEILIFEKDSNGNSNLKTIDGSAFYGNNINSLVIPSSVEIIGNSAFYNNPLTTLEFEGAKDGTSILRTIENNAFKKCSLNYQTEDNPLYLPNSITLIEENAFFDKNDIILNTSNKNLKYIYFEGNRTNFDNNWNGKANVIP